MKTKTKTTILPPMTTTGKRRLRKLIGFLRKLPKAKWNFDNIVSKAKQNGTICGTVCCAIGWLPSVFPRLTKWEKDQGEIYVVPRNKEDYSIWDMFYGAHVEVFGIPMEHSELFVPGCQDTVHESLPICYDGATAKQVAAMLEKYIALTETEARP